MVSTPRKLLAVATFAGAVVLGAGNAQAHVTIDTLGTVEQGSFAKLGFSVPNERDDAGTVQLQVQLPQDHPLVFVSVQAKEGWLVETTTRTLDEPVEAFGASFDEVVDTVTWTAQDDVQIEPGQFDWFWISAGAMPTDVDELAFPAVQTYSSGEVVRWIEPMPESGEEPEFPSPTVALVAPSGDAEAPGAGDEAGDDGTDALTVVALVVGIVGVVLGAAALATGRRRSSTT